MDKKSAEERVQEKFDLANDIKGSKIKTSISNVIMTDGKVTANIEISGLPTPKGQDMYSNSYRTIPKIFDNFDAFSVYAKDLFAKSDEEILKLCK